MTMTAKFSGTCKVCNRRFEGGTQIDWEGGKGAQHLHCPGFSMTRGYYSPSERAEIAAANAAEIEEAYSHVSINGAAANGLMDL